MAEGGKHGLKYGFKTPRDAEKGVLILKKLTEDDNYKIRVVLGVINRIKATVEKVPEKGRQKKMLQSLVIYERYLKRLQDKMAEKEGPDDIEGSGMTISNDADAKAINFSLGDEKIINTDGDTRGLVIKLTEQGAYSIYYWKDDPGVRMGTEVYLDGKKVYMPVKLVHMGFEVDPENKDYDIGRIQTESKKVADEPDLKGHQPKKYYKGLSKDTKSDREKHFEKGRELDDDNPNAYKKAPGDAGAKTKPSKYTKAFKDKFGEVFQNKLQEKLLEKKGSSETALKNKAEKSGAPYSILKQVYNRGVAAWRTGHRPGTTPEQWGLARVNSFITGGKTSSTADKDLYSKWKSKD